MSTVSAPHNANSAGGDGGAGRHGQNEASLPAAIASHPPRRKMLAPKQYDGQLARYEPLAGP